MEHQGNLVEAAGVGGVDDTFERHVGEPRDLALEVVAYRLVAATHDGVGLDAGTAQLGHRVLGGLGLVLARGSDVGHERHVHVADVAVAGIHAELPDGLQERQDLDVSNRATHLGDDNVDVVAGQHPDAALDLVGDVGDDLDGPPQEFAAPLGGYDRRVDGAGGGVRIAGQVLVDEPFVVPEVEVGLAAVVGHEHLAVFERVQRSRVDVDVRVQFLDDDPEAPLLQEPT